MSVPVPGLTRRQEEVYRLAADGLTQTEIAARLWIVVKTVKFHKTGILRALGCHRMHEALALGYRKGWLP